MPSRDGLAPSRIASLNSKDGRSPAPRCQRARSPFNAPQARRSGAWRSERRQTSAGAWGRAVARRPERTVENDRSDDWGCNGLRGQVAEAVTADGGSVRVRWLSRRARGGHGRYGYRVGACCSCERRKIMKQRNHERQRQPQCQRPSPNAPACGSTHDRLRGAAGSFHREPLRLLKYPPLETFSRRPAASPRVPHAPYFAFEVVQREIDRVFGAVILFRFGTARTARATRAAVPHCHRS